MHSFTGPAEMAAECVELGLHISFAGMLTYKKSDDLRAVSATVPLDRLLIETDSPYLSPEPVRKIRRNEPAHVVYTCQCLAEVRGVPVDVVATATTSNARRLFKLD
jgi:TatD DNase family protein